MASDPLPTISEMNENGSNLYRKSIRYLFREQGHFVFYDRPSRYEGGHRHCALLYPTPFLAPPSPPAAERARTKSDLVF